MDKFFIVGGKRLCGTLDVQSAKNSVLPLLAACLLTDDEVVLQSISPIKDVCVMLEILKFLGAKIEKFDDNYSIDCSSVCSYEIQPTLAKELRSSVFLLGSLISRFHKAKICYPGGCDIGLRPIDLHINALKSLGVKIEESGGEIFCECSEVSPCEIMLDCPSVGATENIILSCAVSNGITKIKNAAREPEIVDLQNFINKMGGKISGAGSGTITIEGVKKLHGTIHRPIRDRIEIGTFLVATAMCGGKISSKFDNFDNIAPIIHKLRENGCKTEVKNDIITLESEGKLSSCKLIETMPYPGFPTDMQPQFLALSAIADGCSVVVENLFETRFKHVPELIKMGADITVRGRVAFVRGIKKFRGACVHSPDLRAGAALTLAALSADGISQVTGVNFIDRGYYRFEEKLALLGAQIERK